MTIDSKSVKNEKLAIQIKPARKLTNFYNQDLSVIIFGI
jgi:hypothetical protein